MIQDPKVLKGVEDIILKAVKTEVDATNFAWMVPAGMLEKLTEQVVKEVVAAGYIVVKK